VNAIPADLMRKPPETREAQTDTSEHKFWQWFAIVVLLFCWIAEATLCAERGF
jgi:hypothetical protein